VTPSVGCLFSHTFYAVVGLLAFILNLLVVFRSYLPAELYDALTFGWGMSKTTKGAEKHDPTSKLQLRVPKRLVDNSQYGLLFGVTSFHPHPSLQSGAARP